MRNRLKMLLVATLVALPLASAQAFDIEKALRDLQPGFDAQSEPEIRIVQNGGKTLSEAVEQVRRKTGGQILSAETKV